MFYVYILHCADGTYYVGSTNDLGKRLHSHNFLKSGAHYTKIRRPVKLVYSKCCGTYSQVRELEGELKRLSRTEKTALISAQSKPISPTPKLWGTGKRGEYLAHKKAALVLAVEKVRYFAAKYGVEYGKVTIRNQKSRWGSCSKKGNLNFSYRIVFLPPELQDYLVVHEVCHIKEFNHSRAFWELVVKEIPGYKELRRKLKGIQ